MNLSQCRRKHMKFGHLQNDSLKPFVSCTLKKSPRPQINTLPSVEAGVVNGVNYGCGLPHVWAEASLVPQREFLSLHSH